MQNGVPNKAPQNPGNMFGLPTTMTQYPFRLQTNGSASCYISHFYNPGTYDVNLNFSMRSPSGSNGQSYAQYQAPAGSTVEAPKPMGSVQGSPGPVVPRSPMAGQMPGSPMAGSATQMPGSPMAGPATQMPGSPMAGSGSPGRMSGYPMP